MWDLIFKRELPSLGGSCFVSGTGHLRVKDVCTVALHMSYHIGNGVQVHSFALRRRAEPKRDA